MPPSLRPIRSAVPLVAALAFVAGGCGAVDPYAYVAGEFDAREFQAREEDRERVTLCYNGWVTSEAAIEALADVECSRFGRTARAEGRGFGGCALAAPTEARFACVDPQAAE